MTAPLAIWGKTNLPFSVEDAVGSAIAEAAERPRDRHAIADHLDRAVKDMRRRAEIIDGPRETS